MRAKDESLIEILNTDEKTRFVIPFFQRSYVWEKDNWETLYNDIKQNSNHFLGSIILKESKTKKYEKNVIDGQQRLTTLTILLKALFDLASEDTKMHRIHSCSVILFGKEIKFENGKERAKYYIRLNHSKYDREAYKKVIGTAGIIDGKLSITSMSEDDINSIHYDTHHLILNCYKYFYEELKKEKEETKYKMLNLLSNSDKHILVSIDLDKDHDDEQTIFDTVNNSGKRLSIADIIKNKLFQRLMDLAKKDNIDENKVFDFYEAEWEGLFYKDKDFFDFWNSEVQTGRAKRTNMEVLLYCIAVIKNKYNPAVDYINKLNQTYDELSKNFNTYNEMKDFLIDIINYAYNYVELFKDYASENNYERKNYLKRLLLVTKQLEISTFSPFILSVQSSDLSNEEKEHRYYELEKFLIKNVVCGLSTKNYNNNCVELIRDYEKHSENLYYDERFNSFPSVHNLYKLKNKQATLILFLIELSSIEQFDDIQSLQYIYSLEHIMPKDWGKYWGFNVVIPMDENGNPIEDALEAELNRNKSIGSLGNMTLITKPLNSSLKNKTFHAKINGNSKSKGLKEYATLKITRDIIDDFESGKTIWNETSIYNRLEKFINVINDEWFSK